jgi:hypothetical protein
MLFPRKKTILLKNIEIFAWVVVFVCQMDFGDGGNGRESSMPAIEHSVFITAFCRSIPPGCCRIPGVSNEDVRSNPAVFRLQASVAAKEPE